MPNGSDSLIVQITVAGFAPLTVPAPSDLRFTSATQLGYDECTFTLNLKASPWAAPPSLRGLATVRVMDRRTGQTVWWGRIDDPGLRSDAGGSAWQVKASGGGHELARITKQIMYLDRDAESWRSTNKWPAGKASTIDGSNGFAAHVGDPEAIVPTFVWELPFPGNVKAIAAASAELVYDRPLYSTGDTVRIVAVHGSLKGSFVNTGILFELLVRNASGTLTSFASWTSNTPQVDFSAWKGNGSWPGTNTDVQIMARWLNNSGATITFGDTPQWHRWASLRVAGQRYGIDGTALVPTAHGWTISPLDIVNDVIGQHLAGVVRAGTISVDGTGTINHAAWWKGVTLADVMDFVAQRDGGTRWWGVWSPNPGDSVPRMDWAEWTGQRYIVPSWFTPRLAGGGDDLVNNARVIYAPIQDHVGSVNISGTVAELDVAGLTRSIAVDATDKGILTADQASVIGAGALSDANLARTSGTVEVDGPILDADSGRVVQPWEIRPGAVVLMSATPKRFTGQYTASSTDGVSVFKLTGTSYSVSGNSVELSLDGGGRSLIRQIRRDVKGRRSLFGL
jgi:hypothetical protein